MHPRPISKFNFWDGFLRLVRSAGERSRPGLFKRPGLFFGGLGTGVFEEVVEGLEGLGDDVDVGDDGHEVGVPNPAGDDVPVEMAWESGTGDVAEVEADVEAAGVHDAAHQLEEPLNFMLAFENFFLGEIGEVRFVP